MTLFTTKDKKARNSDRYFNFLFILIFQITSTSTYIQNQQTNKHKITSTSTQNRQINKHKQIYT